MDDPVEETRPAEEASEAVTSGPEEAPKLIKPWMKIAGVLAFLGAALVVLLSSTDMSDALVYSQLVDEVMANPPAFVGRELRVEGELRQGSVQFRDDPCEWRFVLEKSSREMPVRFPRCVVPDTFRDGMGISVTVQGQLQADGTFVASQVIPRCPSKYEMNHSAEEGESPHPIPDETS